MEQAQYDLQTRWWNLEARLVERFGKKPDMETLLFLIGVQELGDIRRKFSKEEKQDLMHIAVCSLFLQSGYYELEGTDTDGWPHFRQLKALPVMGLIEQENFMKDHILLYFETNGGIEFGDGVEAGDGPEAENCVESGNDSEPEAAAGA
jgi:hypothetical protein